MSGRWEWPAKRWARMAQGHEMSRQEDAAHLARIAELEAQVAGLEAMNTEKAAEIRRLRMGNHPAGRALRVADEAAWRDLQVALDARDAEHEGGEGT